MTSTNRDTWLRLLHWDKGSTLSERLAADILELEGYRSIDPAHPLGGPDGLHDMVLRKDGRRWIAAAYFPNGQKDFADVQAKFTSDLRGVERNRAEGFAFVTNQEVSLGERAQLEDSASVIPCEIYHLERLRASLDSFGGLRIRERYLEIPATPADMLAAVDQLKQIGQTIAATTSTAAITDLRRNATLDISESETYKFDDLTRLAQEQGKIEMHRGYVINKRMLPALANFEQPIPAIIILDEFPEGIANCHRVAHEAAMLTFFLQRCIGLSHMELLHQEEREQIVRVIDRLWRCNLRLRPLINNCQSTFLMVGANRLTSVCAHMGVYMCASHFLQEILQASEHSGYTTASDAMSTSSESDALPYDPQMIVEKWPDVVRSLRVNWAVIEGYKQLSDAYNDLAAEAVRAARYEKGLPIIPTWMRLSGPADIQG